MAQEVFEAQLKFKDNLPDLVLNIKDAQEAVRQGAESMDRDLDTLSRRSQESLRKGVSGTIDGLVGNIDKAAGRVRKFDTEIHSVISGWDVMMKQPTRTWGTLFSAVRLGFRQMSGDAKSFTVGFTSIADAIATASGRFEALKPVAGIMGKLAVASERATGVLRTLGIGVRGADRDILMLARSMSRSAEAAKTMVVAWREQHNQAIIAQNDAARKNVDQIKEAEQVRRLIEQYQYLLSSIVAAKGGKEAVPFLRKLEVVGVKLQELGVNLEKLTPAYDTAGVKIAELTQKNQTYAESIRVMTGVHKPLIARIASSTGTINTHIQYLAAAMQKTDIDIAKSAGNLERRLHLANQALRAMATNMEKAQQVGLAIPPEQTAAFEQAKRSVALLTEELRRRITVGKEAAESAKRTSRESANAVEKGSRRSASAMRQYAGATREAVDTNRSLLQYVQPRGMINRGIMQVGARATRASADVGRFSMSMGSIVGMAGAMGGALGKLDPTIAAVTVGVSQMADQAVRSFSAMMSVAGTASEKIKASMAIIANSMMAFGVMAVGLIAKLGMLGAEIETMEITVRAIARNLAREAGIDMEKAADYVIRLRDEITEMNITTKEATRILSSFLRAKLPLDQLKGLAQAAKDFGVTVANMSTSEVLGRFNQFIQTGNSMLLKRLGITKTASMMNEEYAESIGKTVAQLTPYEKSMARIQGILKEVQTVQGVYDEAQKTAAKNLSSLKRLFEEAALSIGKRFLPIITKVIMGIKNLMEWFMELDPSVHDNIAAFIKWTAIIGLSTGALLNLIPAIKAAMKLIMLMGKRMLMMTPQIALIIAALAAIGVVVAALKKIWDDNFGGIQDSVKDLLTTLKTEFKPIIDDVIYWFTTFGKQIQHIVVLVAENIKILVAVISGLVTSLRTKFGPVFDTIRASLNGFMRAVSRVLLTVQSLLRGDWENAWKHAEAAVVDVLTSIALLFKNTVAKAAVWGWNLIVELANGIQKAATTVLAKIMQWIGNVISRFLAPGSPPAEGPLSHIVEWGRGVMETYLRAFGLADFSLLRDIMSPISQALQDAVSAGTLGEAALPGTIKAVREQVGNLLAEFRKTGEVNADIMDSISESLGEGGRDIMEYIRRLMFHQKALRALQDVQKEYAEAEATGFIPAELKERLKMAEEEANATKEAVDWQKEFIAAQKETVDLQAQMLKALEKMESALGKAADSMKDAAAAMEDMPFAWELPDVEDIESIFPEDMGERVGLGAVSEEWLEMREKIDGVIQGIKDFIALPLAEKFQIISDFLADVGGKVVTWLEDVTGIDVSGYLENFGKNWSEAWRIVKTWATTTWDTTIKPKLDDFVAWLDTNLPIALKAAQDAVERVWNWIVKKTKWLYDKLVGKSIIPDLVGEEGGGGIIGWFDKLERWFKDTKLYKTLETIGNAFKEIGKFLGALGVVAGFLAVVALFAKFGAIVSVVVGFITGLAETLSIVALMASGAATAIAGFLAPIAAIAAAIGAVLWGIWENKDQILGYWEDFKNEVLDVWDRLKPSLEAFWKFVKPILEFLGKLFAGVVGGAIMIVIAAVQGLWDTIKEVLPKIKEIFSGVFSVIYGVIKATILPIINIIVGLFNLITGQGDEAKESFLAAWENLKDGVGLIWDGIVKIVGNAIGAIITFFTSLGPNFLKRLATLGETVLEKLGMGDLVEKIKKFGETIKKFWRPVKKFFDLLTKTFAYLKGAKNLSDLFERLKEVLPELLAALGPLIIAMREKLAEGLAAGWEKIKEWAAELWMKIAAKLLEFKNKIVTWVKDTWVAVKAKFAEWVTGLRTAISFFITQAIEYIKTNVPIWARNVGDKLSEWITTAIAYFRENVPIWIGNIFHALGNLVGGIIKKLPAILGGVALAIIGVIAGWPVALLVALGALLLALKPWFEENWPVWKAALSEFFSNIWAGLVVFFTEKLPLWITDLGNWLQGVWDGFVLWLATNLPVWIDALSSWLKDVWDGFVKWLTEDLPIWIQAFTDWMGDVWDGFVKWLTEELPIIAQDMLDWFGDMWDKFIVFVTEKAPDYLKSFLDFFAVNVIAPFVKGVLEKGPEWLKDLVQVGTDIVNGILDGLKTAWETLKKWFTDRIEDVPQWMRDLLGIESPSMIFAEIGKQMAEGVGLGFDLSDVKKKMLADMTGMLSSLQGISLSGQMGAQMAGLMGQLAAAPTSVGGRYNFYEGAFAGAFPGVRDGRDGQDVMRQFQTYLENADTRARGA